MRTFYHLLVVTTAFFGTALGVPAQDQWHQTQGPDGGYINDIARGPNAEFYAAARHLFRSTDFGRSWNRTNLPGGYVQFVACAPNGTVYAGGREIVTGSGIQSYRSTDHGTSWSPIFTARDLDVSEIEVTPQGTLIVRSFDTLWRSTDAGETATAVLAFKGNGSSSSLGALAISPAGDIFVGARRPDASATLDPVYRSTDDGITWQGFSAGLNDTAVAALTFLPGGVMLLCQGFDRVGEGTGVYRSTNNGESWTRLTQDHEFHTFVPGNTLTSVIAGSLDSGLYRSTDAGTSWQQVTLPKPGRNPTALATTGDGVLMAGTQTDGIYRTTDDGLTWRRSNEGLISTEIAALAAVGSDRLIASVAVYGGRNTFRSSDDGGSWMPDTQFTFRPSAFAVGHDGTLYAATLGGGVQRTSDDGMTWTGMMGDLPSTRISASSIAVGSSNDLHAYIFDPQNSTGDLYRTDDAGAHWIALGFATNAPPGRTPLPLAVTPSGTILTGTRPGIGFLRRSASGTWTRVDTAIFKGPIISLAVMPTGTILVVMARGLDYFMYRSTDDGLTWGPTGRDSVIYLATAGNRIVATGRRLYLSVDDGMTWQAVADTMPPLTTAVAIAPDGDVFVGTVNDGVYSLKVSGAGEANDAPPLRELPLLSAAPNPTSDALTIMLSLTRRSAVHLRIVDALGKRVAAVETPSLESGLHRFPVDVRELPEGFYIIDLKSDTGAVSGSFVIVR